MRRDELRANLLGYLVTYYLANKNKKNCKRIGFKAKHMLFLDDSEDARSLGRACSGLCNAGLLSNNKSRGNRRWIINFNSFNDLV